MGVSTRVHIAGEEAEDEAVSDGWRCRPAMSSVRVKYLELETIDGQTKVQKGLEVKSGSVAKGRTRRGLAKAVFEKYLVHGLVNAAFEKYRVHGLVNADFEKYRVHGLVNVAFQKYRLVNVISGKCWVHGLANAAFEKNPVHVLVNAAFEKGPVHGLGNVAFEKYPVHGLSYFVNPTKSPQFAHDTIRMGV